MVYNYTQNIYISDIVFQFKNLPQPENEKNIFQVCEKNIVVFFFETKEGKKKALSFFKCNHDQELPFFHLFMDQVGYF